HPGPGPGRARAAPGPARRPGAAAAAPRRLPAAAGARGARGRGQRHRERGRAAPGRDAGHPAWAPTECPRALIHPNTPSEPAPRGLFSSHARENNVMTTGHTMGLAEAADTLKIHPHSLEKLIRAGEISAG